MKKSIKSLGLYRIEYQNGIVQFKNLIEHEEFLNIVRPSEIRLDYLKSISKLKRTPECLNLKTFLKQNYGQYFTNKSPIFEAITTNKLILLPHQGTYDIKVEKINL